MDIIFGAFSETSVMPITSISSQSFSRHSKRYTNLDVKSCLKLNKKTGRVEAAKLYVSNATLQVLSSMVLINLVTFLVFKILFNLVSMQNLLNENNC